MYVANYYIGREYTPGEVLDETVPKEVIDRLLKSGAIRKVAPDPGFAEAETGDPSDGQIDGATDAGGQGEDQPDGEESTTEEDTPEEEIDEEAEPEEIDVMAGIVTEPKAPSKSKGTAGKAASKATGKRGSK